MKFERFLQHEQLVMQLEASRLLVTHAGMGLIGDGLRAGCRVIVVPRKGRTTRSNPANDQTRFAYRLAEQLPVRVCEDLSALKNAIETTLADESRPVASLGSDIPKLIGNFLAQTPPTQRWPAQRWPAQR